MKQILEQLECERIQIYDFPDCPVATDLEPTEAQTRQALKARMPFAVISSDQIVCDTNGTRRRVRKYPWGEVEGNDFCWLSFLLDFNVEFSFRLLSVDNLDHSDFSALKRLIINYHMLDMIEHTDCVFYETYRKEKLGSLAKPDDQSIR